MKHYLIGLALILLVVHLNYGFSLPRIDLQHPTKLLYKSNDGSTLSVSDSYVEKPTLKEIVYYHLIERPYPEGKEQEKTKAKISEDTFDLDEDLDIDPRKDEPIKNSYSTEKPKYGKRQRRDVSLERIPSKRAKRTFYRNWGPLTSDLSRIHTQHLPDYVRELFTEEKPVVKQQNSKYAYLVGRLPSTQVEKNNEVMGYDKSDDEIDSESTSDESGYTEEPNVVEYLEYGELDNENNNSEDDDISIKKEKGFNEKNKPDVYIELTTIRNNKHSRENSKVSDTSEDDLSDITAWNDDNDNDDDNGSSENEEIGCEDGEDCDESGEDTYPNFDDILNEIHQIFVDENSTIEISKGVIDNPQNLNVLNLVHNVLKEQGKSTNQGVIIKTKPDQSNFVDALRGLFTNIVKNNVIINNHAPVTPKFIDITAEKDRIKHRENSNNTIQKPVTAQNFKDHNSTTENPKEEVTPTVDAIYEKTNKSNDIGQSKDKDLTLSPLEPTTATAIISNVTDIDKNKLNDTKNQTTINKINKKTNISEDNQSKDNDFTSPPLESTTAPVIVLNATEIDKNKSNDTDKLINSTLNPVSSTTPAMTTESSIIGSNEPTTPGKQEPTTSNPTKIENNVTNEREDGTDANKKIGFMLDLVKNENFWKFMGDLGGKYLESLMAHTQSVIKEQIADQIKEHLDTLNKYDEKLLEKKEEAKENKLAKEPIEKAGEKNRVAKNINETVSIKAHNLYGNTVGNDKVTNVYVFYANEHIDELIKNIQEIVNKTKPANNTNIFSFIVKNLEVNNGTNKKPTTTIESEVTTKLPIATVNPVAEKPNNEQNPTEPTTNTFDNKHPINIENHNETDYNCDHDKSHCDKIKVSTKPSVNPDQNNITAHPADSVDSKTVSKEQTPDVTTHVIDFKIPVTESTDKPTPTTDIILTKEPITVKIDETTESVAAKQTTVVQVTEVQTGITKHNTHSGVITNAIPTTEPVISKVSTIADTKIASTTERTSITQVTTLDTTTESPTEKSKSFNNETQNTTISDIEKATTESVKPETSDISSTTELTTTAVSETTVESTTEKYNITSDDDRDKVTTERMKPETSDISSTTETTNTALSETTVESTTEKYNITSDDDRDKVTTESLKPEISDSPATELITTAVSETTVGSTTEKHNVTIDDDVDKVTAERIKPETSDISSTTEITTTAVSETTVGSTTEKHNVTSDDDRDKVTTESLKPETSDISSTTEITTTAVSETTVECTTEKHTVTSDDDNAKVTSDSMTSDTSDISLATKVTSTVSDTLDKNSTVKTEVANKVTVTTESIKSVADNIGSLIEIASHDTASSTDHPNSDLNDITTAKPNGKIGEENDHNSTGPSLTKLRSDDDKTNTFNTTDSVTDDESSITEKAESTKVDTKSKKATESTTEKQEEGKS